ncbi:MAG: NADP-dependent phosphogluconate dehydrogenase [Acidibacillus sp.]|uniref:6-phosphogluconate dehydrogenase, decarboxylating n=1 Tax=Sulfoacidibacillus ferrooxidans TaxID=2005001 RepID=A0A9X2ACC0_9BACL|nr:NADP-dependent phosphogluconate dehydrogenase [Sulfoacidibacillus ferrooxidans]MCI0183983.1 6-phosphogluconate dehydrogenase, NADP(+)-dependent, decarboxylating [Sulfoacidibacillus ferrooxidans]MCY0894468.1 NADP-dependent phosphogluconate dehydrogenase [Acidibacillus sp.]
MECQDVGVVGLAVMGKNLALNIESRGYSVSLFNRSPDKTQELIAEYPNAQLLGTYSIEEFVSSIKRPRRIILMVKAGSATDDTIAMIRPYLEAGDLIVDGGNSFYQDTIQRELDLAKNGILFIGTGISGGEEGALHGPSIMPSGDPKAYQMIEPILTKIAAQVSGEPCCTYIGPNGAGHYVKMVHNGIEYGDMQLIAESYQLLHDVLELDATALHEMFLQWNQGELDSYLIEITADIFNKMDPETNQPLVDMILDTAKQKGTGRWASDSALELGVPLSVITEAVFARCLSSMKDERVAASRVLVGPTPSTEFEDFEEFSEAVRQALYISKMCSYAQGFAQMSAASAEYGWNLQLDKIASIFRGGCIIRARFLQNIMSAYTNNPQLTNLLLDPYFRDVFDRYQDSLRKIVSIAAIRGIPVPAMANALMYYDAYRRERLPANLIQAQRDYFGAHTYERVDRPGTFHTEWSK